MASVFSLSLEGLIQSYKEFLRISVTLIHFSLDHMYNY